MMTLFDQEYAVERYGDEKKAEGLAEGEAKGALQKAKETAFSMKENGFPESTIARILKASPLTIQQWLANAPDVPLYQ